MRIREFTFKHKNIKNKLSYVEFESVEECLEKTGPEDFLRIYNFGAKELAKKLFVGKNPFINKRKSIKLRFENLSEEQMSFLKQQGLLDPVE